MFSLFRRNKPAKRWDAEKLATVKSYLETKPPLTWTREDNYLAVEFVIQRYLPADAEITQAQCDARLAEMKTKVDWNIDHPEEAGKEEVKEAPEFAAWLRETLKSRIEREEILSLLSHFDNEDEWYEQEKALKVFRFWLEKPQHFDIDADLHARMREVMGAGS